MTSRPSNRTRDLTPKIPDLEELVFQYVLTNNMLGSILTDVYIANAATDAFKGMQAVDNVGANKVSKASSKCVTCFKRRNSLCSNFRRGELHSAHIEGVKQASSLFTSSRLGLLGIPASQSHCSSSSLLPCDPPLEGHQW